MKSLLLGTLALFLAAPLAAFEVIRLDDGTVVRGEVVGQTDSTVTIKSENLGEIVVKRRHIASSPVKDSEFDSRAVTRKLSADPIAHTLVLMPTAFFPPHGSIVFRDFELLFLTLGYSPTDFTSIVAGGMFPITPQFNAATFGIKQGLYQNKAATTALAVAGNVTVPFGSDIDEAGFLWLLNGIASHRVTPGFAVHGAIGGVGAQGNGESARSMSFALGTDVRLTGSVKFLAEFLRGGTTFDPGSSMSLINAGIRLHGERLSADLCAMRPIGADLGDWWALPLVSVGYRF